jgi:hypothetical protein
MISPTNHWGAQFEIFMLPMMPFKKMGAFRPMQIKTTLEFSIPITLFFSTQGLHHAT